MTVAISARHWERALAILSARQMANLLIGLAKRVRLESFRKSRASPKKTAAKPQSFKRKIQCLLAHIREISWKRQQKKSF